MLQKTKKEKLARILAREISDGSYGASGAEFLTVRQLCDVYSISLQTAQDTVDILKKNGILARRGRRLYISHRVPANQSMIRIGALVPQMDNPFYSSMLNALELRGRQMGMEVIAAGYAVDNLRIDQINMLKSCGAKGLIVALDVSPNSLMLIESCELPYVLNGLLSDAILEKGVAVDDREAGRIAAEHLLKCGCMRFLFLGFVREQSKKDLRLVGYSEMLKNVNYNLSEEQIMLIDIGQQDNESERLAQWLLSEKKKNVRLGVFCFHDLLAMRLIRAAKMVRLNIPNDICIIGMDNLRASSEIMPSLSSIAYPFSRIADSTLRLLKQKITGIPDREKIENVIHPMLICRESTNVKKGE